MLESSSSMLKFSCHYVGGCRTEWSGVGVLVTVWKILEKPFSFTSSYLNSSAKKNRKKKLKKEEEKQFSAFGGIFLQRKSEMKM
jgi:hypothetical protein